MIPRRSWWKTPATLAVLMLAGLGIASLDAADPPTPTPADTGIDRGVITGGSDERTQEIDPGTGTRVYRLGPETVDDQGRGHGGAGTAGLRDDAPWPDQSLRLSSTEDVLRCE